MTCRRRAACAGLCDFPSCTLFTIPCVLQAVNNSIGEEGLGRVRRELLRGLTGQSPKACDHRRCAWLHRKRAIHCGVIRTKSLQDTLVYCAFNSLRKVYPACIAARLFVPASPDHGLE